MSGNEAGVRLGRFMRLGWASRLGFKALVLPALALGLGGAVQAGPTASVAASVAAPVSSQSASPSASLSASPSGAASAASDCRKPLYLTFDTGHMGVAPLIAQTLKRHKVRATFFAAHERTQEGDGTLGTHWASWWRERGREGHAFASHTYEHAYWRADVKAAQGGAPDFRIQISGLSEGAKSGVWTAAQYCQSLHKASERLTALTGVPSLPLFRPAGGRSSPALLAAARRCGYEAVFWADAGFLGDELPSERYPNAQLLQQALSRIRSGDILMAHLGIWSRQDPWAPAVLDPLLAGLKKQGFCFQTLDAHPRYREWVAGAAKASMRATVNAAAHPSTATQAQP